MLIGDFLGFQKVKNVERKRFVTSYFFQICSLHNNRSIIQVRAVPTPSGSQQNQKQTSINDSDVEKKTFSKAFVSSLSDKATLNLIYIFFHQFQNDST